MCSYRYAAGRYINWNNEMEKYVSASTVILVQKAIDILFVNRYFCNGVIMPGIGAFIVGNTRFTDIR